MYSAFHGTQSALQTIPFTPYHPYIPMMVTTLRPQLPWGRLTEAWQPICAPRPLRPTPSIHSQSYSFTLHVTFRWEETDTATGRTCKLPQVILGIEPSTFRDQESNPVPSYCEAVILTTLPPCRPILSDTYQPSSNLTSFVYML